MTKENKDSSVCPDLSILEEKGKELHLREGTITKAKDYAIEYFKKVENMHKNPGRLMPAFLYIAAIVMSYEYRDYGERRTQLQIEKVFNICSPTISKWYKRIIDELHIDIVVKI